MPPKEAQADKRAYEAIGRSSKALAQGKTRWFHVLLHNRKIALCNGVKLVLIQFCRQPESSEKNLVLVSVGFMLAKSSILSVNSGEKLHGNFCRFCLAIFGMGWAANSQFTAPTAAKVPKNLESSGLSPWSHYRHLNESLRANPNGSQTSFFFKAVKRIILNDYVAQIGCANSPFEFSACDSGDVCMRTNETKGSLAPQPVSVFVIEANREMQRLLRSMLMTYGIRDVRVFSDSARASSAMVSDPPSAVILDWEATPHTGAEFLKLFRHQNMYPVCLVPMLVMVSEARSHYVERALKLGAQAIVAKPLSPEVLIERLRWVLAGKQKLRLVGERYVVDGVRERLKIEREREQQMESARAYQESQFEDMADIQRDVDRLLESSF